MKSGLFLKGMGQILKEGPEPWAVSKEPVTGLGLGTGVLSTFD